MFIIDKIKELPDSWLISATSLLLPLSIGLGVKLTQADSFSFRHADTEINLGNIKEAIDESDDLVDAQQEQLDTLIEAHEKLSAAAKKKKIKLPELEAVSEAIEASEELSVEVKENNEDLQNYIEEQEN